jgi:hypothetical protein
MRRASLAAVLAVLVTAVMALAAGCGGKGNSTAGGPSASASSSAGNGPPSTPTAEPTTAPPRTPPTAKSGEGEGTATEAAGASTLCGYLERDLPRLRAVGSPVGALAQLAIGLSAWVEKHPSKRPARSSSLDAETERNCPAVRKAVLAVLKGDSFSSVV